LYVFGLRIACNDQPVPFRARVKRPIFILSIAPECTASFDLPWVDDYLTFKFTKYNIGLIWYSLLVLVPEYSFLKYLKGVAF
jgi:hypothetical protein